MLRLALFLANFVFLSAMASVPFCSDLFRQVPGKMSGLFSEPTTMGVVESGDSYQIKKMYQLAPDLEMHVQEDGPLFGGKRGAPSKIDVRLWFQISLPYDVSQLVIQKKDFLRSFKISHYEIMKMMARMGLERAFQKTRRVLKKPKLKITFKGSGSLTSYYNDNGTYEKFVDIQLTPSDILPTTLMKESQVLQEQLAVVLLENYGKSIWTRHLSDVIREKNILVDEKEFASSGEKIGPPFILKTPFGDVEGQVTESIFPPDLIIF